MTVKVGLPLIRTKFHQPSLPADHLRRLELLDLLEKDRQRPLVLVSAPAGYGKSTLVSCWLEGCQRPSAWLSLDESDNDLRQFLSYFVAAVQTIFPEAVRDTIALINAPNLSPASVLAATLINDLERIEQEFIVVLDDIHCIQEKAVHDFFNMILRHPSRSIQIVMIGRRDPVLPIPFLRGKGLLTEVRMWDLRFRVDESLEFLQAAMGQQIEESVAIQLAEKSEGWVTGLRLAVLAMRGQDDTVLKLLELKGTARYVLEYLASEVLDHQAPDIRYYLFSTSILNRFCAPLCDVVCRPDVDSRQADFSLWDFINLLKKENLFIINLDAENRWFRYHHLFQQLLQNQLKRYHSPEEISALHSRASQWFAEQGFIEEAIQHSLAGGDFDAAGRLISQHGHALIGQERVANLERWLHLLPHKIVENTPMLLIFKAWIGRVRVQSHLIADNLNRAETLLRENPETGNMSDCLWGYLNCIRSFERYLMIDSDEALAHSRRAIDLIPERYGYMRSFSFVVHSAALQMKGQYRDAASVMDSALADVALQGGYMQGIMLHSLGKICMMESALLAQRNAANRLLRTSKRPGLLVFFSWGQFNLACSYYHLNDLKAAKTTLASFMENRHIMYPDTVSDGAAILSLSCQGLNQPHEACDVADLLNEHALETENTRLQIIGEALQAELALRQGRLSGALGWARDFKPRQLKAHYFFYLPEMTLARVLVTEDTPDSRHRAQDLLTNLEEFSRATHNYLILIPVLALQAKLLDRQADESASLEKLAEAVSLAEPGGGIRFFLDQGFPMANLLKRLLKQNVAVDYIGKLLAAFGDEEPEAVLDVSESKPAAKPSVRSQPLVEPLTQRELDVLELLFERLQNKEIADKLFISNDTVKWHLKNIYQKLGVNDRRQAVERAKNLGFFV